MSQTTSFLSPPALPEDYDAPADAAELGVRELRPYKSEQLVITRIFTHVVRSKYNVWSAIRTFLSKQALELIARVN